MLGPATSLPNRVSSAQMKKSWLKVDDLACYKEKECIVVLKWLNTAEEPLYVPGQLLVWKHQSTSLFTKRMRDKCANYSHLYIRKYRNWLLNKSKQESHSKK
jgi:hypothetical protein